MYVREASVVGLRREVRQGGRRNALEVARLELRSAATSVLRVRLRQGGEKGVLGRVRILHSRSCQSEKQRNVPRVHLFERAARIPTSWIIADLMRQLARALLTVERYSFLAHGLAELRRAKCSRQGLNLRLGQTMQGHQPRCHRAVQNGGLRGGRIVDQRMLESKK